MSNVYGTGFISKISALYAKRHHDLIKIMYDKAHNSTIYYHSTYTLSSDTVSSVSSTIWLLSPLPRRALSCILLLSKWSTSSFSHRVSTNNSRYLSRSSIYSTDRMAFWCIDVLTSYSYCSVSYSCLVTVLDR